MRAALLLTIAALLCAAPAHAALQLEPAFSGGSVSQPMYVTSPPGDTHRLFIVSRPGVIRVAIDGVLQPTPFLDISSRVATAGEGGLASLAFDPGYSDPASPGYQLFYVYFVEKPGAGETNGPVHIEEFRATSQDLADPASSRVVVEIPHNDANNHYAGTLQFRPTDNLLYIATGDGGGSNNQYGNAQDPRKSLLGKLLRIDPHKTQTAPYSIPAGNPYAGQPLCNPPGGTTNCPEILAQGLRNPFRWSFDSDTGDLTIGDVGQGSYEEVDYVPAATALAGVNFGWPCREGPNPGPDPSECPGGTVFTDPIGGYSHAGLSGSLAITGGVVVRDPALTPIVGRYLYADFYKGVIHSLTPATPTATDDRVESDLPVVAQLVSFGQDAQKHVYVLSLGGAVQRIVCDSACPAPATTTPPPDPSPGPAPAPIAQVPVTQSPSGTPVKDRRPLRLTLRAQRRQAIARLGHLRIAAIANKPCWARATAPGMVRSSALKLTPGARRTFQLRASKRRLRALVKRGALTVTVRARDDVGNVVTARLRIRLRR